MKARRCSECRQRIHPERLAVIPHTKTCSREHSVLRTFKIKARNLRRFRAKIKARS